MIPTKKHSIVAILFFVLAAGLGLLLRSFPISPFTFEYRYVVHAHSHVALLGWIYTGLITLIGHFFLKNHVPKKIYNRVFYFTVITVLGMMASFPFQGYAAISITFSTLFLFSSYFYCWMFLKYVPQEYRDLYSYKTVKYALFYMLLSSIGPWTIGVIMSTLGPASHWYHISIYFYLHFQYNAWMILGLLGIFLKILESNNISISKSHYRDFSFLFHIGVILTFFISVLFTKPAGIFYALSIFGSVLQLISWIIIYQFYTTKRTEIKSIFKNWWYLIRLLFILSVGKSVLQLLGSFPIIAALITAHTYLTIGFLHWIFLGIITLALFVFLQHAQLIRINSMNIRLYLTGFTLTELIIFYKPMAAIFNIPLLPYYNWVLFIASLLILVSIIFVLSNSVYKTKTTQQQH